MRRAGAAVAAEALFAALSRAMVRAAARNGTAARALPRSAPTGWRAPPASAATSACGSPDRELTGRFETLDEAGRLVLRLPDGARRDDHRRRGVSGCAAPRPPRCTHALMAASTDELVFAPLGGVGEIGMNCRSTASATERSASGSRSISASSFAGDDLPGIDLIMPDIRFLVEERRNLVGLVLTHAHEDHFGALLDLWPRLRVPVYATPFTAALLEAKRLSEPGAPDIPVKVVPLGARFTLGAVRHRARLGRRIRSRNRTR